MLELSLWMNSKGSCSLSMICFAICLIYPEYSISKEQIMIIFLGIIVLKAWLLTKPLNFKNKDKNNNFYFKKNCAYFQNICDKICNRCKMTICESYSKDDDKELYELNIGEEIIRLNSVQNIMDSQYIYALIIFKNMNITVQYARLIFAKSAYIWELSYRMTSVNESNLEYKLTDKTKIFNTNPLVLHLCMVTKALYFCYKKANENSKLTLNIILNRSLEDNILCMIEDDSLSKINEIKNNFLSKCRY